MATQSLDAVPTAPRIGDLAQDRELANVVGIVVGHYLHLPQDDMLVVARNRAGEVGPVIGRDTDDRRQVALERRDAFVPLLCRRPSVPCRPVVPWRDGPMRQSWEGLTQETIRV